ncbi:hypothetical protein BTJ45_01151 [Bacillus mycoides]|nr:hypothetical protein BTJ45_01151 [Bacillus mycoides]
MCEVVSQGSYYKRTDAKQGAANLAEKVTRKNIIKSNSPRKSKAK